MRAIFFVIIATGASRGTRRRGGSTRRQRSHAVARPTGARRPAALASLGRAGAPGPGADRPEGGFGPFCRTRGPRWA